MRHFNKFPIGQLCFISIVGLLTLTGCASSRHNVYQVSSFNTEYQFALQQPIGLRRISALQALTPKNERERLRVNEAIAKTALLSEQGEKSDSQINFVKYAEPLYRSVSQMIKAGRLSQLSQSAELLGALAGEVLGKPIAVSQSIENLLEYCLPYSQYAPILRHDDKQGWAKRSLQDACFYRLNGSISEAVTKEVIAKTDLHAFRGAIETPLLTTQASFGNNTPYSVRVFVERVKKDSNIDLARFN